MPKQMCCCDNIAHSLRPDAFQSNKEANILRPMSGGDTGLRAHSRGIPSNLSVVILYHFFVYFSKGVSLKGDEASVWLRRACRI